MSVAMMHILSTSDQIQGPGDVGPLEIGGEGKRRLRLAWPADGLGRPPLAIRGGGVCTRACGTVLTLEAEWVPASDPRGRADLCWMILVQHCHDGAGWGGLVMMRMIAESGEKVDRGRDENSGVVEARDADSFEGGGGEE